MKKMLSLLLCAALTLSLTACGAGQSETPVAGAPDPQPEAEQPAPQPEAEEPVVEEPEVQQPEAAVVWTLDTVPRPSEKMGELYDEGQMGYYFQNMEKEVGDQKLADYKAALEAAGFALEVTSESEDDCEITAASGNAEVYIYWSRSVLFEQYYYNMGVTITVEQPSAPQGSQMSFDLPKGSWTSDDHSSDKFCFHKNTSYDLTLEDAQNYVETLKSDSYWFNFEVTDGEGDGEIYFFSAFGEDPKLNRVTVSVRETGDPEKPLMTMVTFRESVG